MTSTRRPVDSDAVPRPATSKTAGPTDSPGPARRCAVDRMSETTSRWTALGLALWGLALLGCTASVGSAIEPTPAAGCTEDQIQGDQRDGTIRSAYRVDDGRIGDLCFGAADDRLLEAWAALADVADRSDLAPIVLVAGYQNADLGTLAFAGPLFETNDRFVIAVLLDAVDDDPEELRFTMVHELGHVLAQTPDQLDVDVERADCETFHNSLGCFRRGSLMADWIDRFWSDAELATLPLDGEADQYGAEDRCNVDPRYLGVYAASHPEEDFAETMAAYVFGMDVPAAVETKVSFFSSRSRFDGLRDRAEAAGLTDFRNDFERCG